MSGEVAVKRLVLVLAAVSLLLTACGGRPRFESPDRTASEEERDYSECDWEASRATAGLADSGERDDRVRDLVVKCMRARGYSPK